MGESPAPYALCFRLAVVIGTIAAGLVLRLVPTGLPGGIVKHGGSMLWAVMLFAVVALLRPRWSPRRCGVAAAIVAGGIELSQLHHDPVLDTVRAGGVGALVLGRVFSAGDLAVYLSTIAIAAAADRARRRRHEKGRSAASCGPAPSRTI